MQFLTPWVFRAKILISLQDKLMEKALYSIASFIVGIITSPIFWIVLAVLAVIIIIVSLYRLAKSWALGKVEYYRYFSKDGIFIGESLDLIERIKNPTCFPLFSVRVHFFVPSGLTVDEVRCAEYTKVSSIFYIPPFSTVQKRHTVIPDKRNHYKLGTATITYRKNEFIFFDELDFYAYPNLNEIKNALSPELCYSGNVMSAKKYVEDPFFSSGIRPYQSGDPLRSINFKASVRSFSGGMRQLVCNKYDSSRNYDSMIFLDLFSYPDTKMDDEERLEIGLNNACFLFLEALKNAGRVGFSANSAKGSSKYIHVPCGCGDAHSKILLETFAELNWFSRHDYSISAVLTKIVPTLGTDTDIFLITSFVDEKLSSIISQIKKMGYIVHIIPIESRRET